LPGRAAVVNYLPHYQQLPEDRLVELMAGSVRRQDRRCDHRADRPKVEGEADPVRAESMREGAMVDVRREEHRESRGRSRDLNAVCVRRVLADQLVGQAEADAACFAVSMRHRLGNGHVVDAAQPAVLMHMPFLEAGARPPADR
jgi:hypothetical protein